MLRTTLETLLISGTTLGALLATTLPAAASDQIDRAFATGSPVQANGTAPPGALPTLAPPPGAMNQGMPAQAPPAIQLLNDPETGGDVWFLIDGQEKSLKPGETLDLAAGQSHLVEFNTGGQQGDTKFTLYQGLYKFKVAPDGWGLFKSSTPPSVSHSPAMQSPQPGGPHVDRRGFHPPLPAEDLRTRRIARHTPEAHHPIDAPLKPADSTAPGRDATGSISAPTPPAPGVIRERTRPATNP